ncbi:glycosyltransferase family 28 protein, partial [Oesophagostomum dentatum]
FHGGAEGSSSDIISAFTTFLNVTFIWKYEGDDILFGDYSNIHPMKWIPQEDLLADKRLSLFITHGGANSLMEAMQYGKPVIAIPLFYDQPLNSQAIRRIGIGTVIDRNKFNRKSLTDAIQKTLYDKEIKRQAEFVAYMLKGRPQHCRSEVAKWAEAIIKYGRMDHLILHSRNMGFIQYYCLDIIACFISAAVVVIAVVLWLRKRVRLILKVSKVKFE